MGPHTFIVQRTGKSVSPFKRQNFFADLSHFIFHFILFHSISHTNFLNLGGSFLPGGNYVKCGETRSRFSEMQNKLCRLLCRDLNIGGPKY